MSIGANELDPAPRNMLTVVAEFRLFTRRPIGVQREMFNGTFFDEFGISGREERTFPFVAEAILDRTQIFPNRNEYENIILA